MFGDGIRWPCVGKTVARILDSMFSARGKPFALGRRDEVLSHVCMGVSSYIKAGRHTRPGNLDR